MVSIKTRKEYYKKNPYRANITYLDSRGNKKYSVMLRFENKSQVDNYTNKIKNVRVKHLGNISIQKKKVVRKSTQYNPFGSYKLPKF